MARVARLSGLCAWSLVLAVALLVWWPVPAQAWGSSGGALHTYDCWAAAVAGHPSYGGCADHFMGIRDADAQADLATFNINAPSYTHTFVKWNSCTETGNCAYQYAKTLKTDGSTSYINNGILFKKTTRTDQECQGAGYMKVGSSCFCEPGYGPLPNGSCVPATCPRAGTGVPGSDGQTYISSDSSSSSYMGCFGGCLVSGAFGAQQQSTPPQHFIMGPLVHTGQQCNPNDQGGTYPGVTGDNKTPSCPPPKCPGTVNGTSVCVACDITSTGGMSKPSDSQNSGGTDTTTSCQGGVCTTTTKDVGADGSAGPSTGSHTGTGGSNPNANGTGTGGDGTCTGSDCEDKPGFCEENPEAIICKESSWGGTCEAQFTCDGDEVQCAIAKEQHNRNCALYVTETDLSRKGKDIADAASDRPPDHPFSTPNTTSIDFASNIDTSDRLGGSCPAGKSVTVAGVSVVVVTPELCGSFELAGTILVAIGALASMVIVFRG